MFATSLTLKFKKGTVILNGTYDIIEDKMITMSPITYAKECTLLM